MLEEQGNVLHVTAAVGLSPSHACIPNRTPTAVPSNTLMIRPDLACCFYLPEEGGVKANPRRGHGPIRPRDDLQCNAVLLLCGVVERQQTTPTKQASGDISCLTTECSPNVRLPEVCETFAMLMFDVCVFVLVRIFSCDIKPKLI